MRCTSVSLLLSLAPNVIAKSPIDWNSSLPFRPDNITGLASLYDWVGSYFNATTEIELTPLIGNTVDESACPSMRDKTFTASFPSVLVITERGPYNVGLNAVNMGLSLWKPGSNFSTIPEEPLLVGGPSFAGELTSTPFTYRGSNDTVYTALTAEGSHISDNFNLTLSKTSKAPYNLTGRVIGSIADSLTFYANMSSCNTSIESSLFSVGMISDHWWAPPGWNWTYPFVNLEFDSKTANITMNGYFSAISEMLPNATDGSRELEYGPDHIYGKMRLSFRGVIDTYHSDILVNNSDVPQWIRTVGFGNNSLNIGYESAASAMYSATDRWTFLQLPLYTIWLLCLL